MRTPVEVAIITTDGVTVFNTDVNKLADAVALDGLDIETDATIFDDTFYDILMEKGAAYADAALNEALDLLINY
jgi:hypothetical protein